MKRITCALLGMLKRDGNLVIRLTDMNDRKERYIDAVEGLFCPLRTKCVLKMIAPLY